MNVCELSRSILAETEKIIVGKADVIKLIINAILADGHVLLNDLPGVGKTTLVKTLSIALGLSSERVQFVSDMLPSDITGMNIFNQKTGDFEYRKGPVMTNILLADEINRALPRTQSALLEAMEERQVSIDGKIIPLPRPFIVLATQNPVESESTFRLPTAQMDRFLICTGMGYPDPSEERHMLDILGDRIPFESVMPVSSPEILENARTEIEKVYVSEAVSSYIIAIADATRKDRRLRLGISPRGTRSMYRMIKARAAMDGRDFATPDDVKALSTPVFEHRLISSGNVRFGGMSEADILTSILDSVPASPDPDTAGLS